MELHVVADDMGAHAAVDAAILRAWEQGILSAASLLPTGKTAADAVAAALETGLPLGLHANLVEGRPLLDATSVPTLVDASGRFFGSAGRFFQRYWRGKIRRLEIEQELTAQVEWMQQRGIAPVHLDSHQHVHLWGSLLPIFIDVAQRNGISRIRMSSFPPEQRTLIPIPKLKYLLLSILGISGKRKLARAGIRYCDRLWGLAVTGKMNKGYLMGVLRRLKLGNHEVVCHPSLLEEGSEALGWQSRGTEELEALLDDEVVELVEALKKRKT